MHEPRHEIWVGVATPATEVAARVDAILDRAAAAGHDSSRPTAHDDARAAAVHDRGLLEFLGAAAERVGSRARTTGWSARTGWCPTSSRPRR